jgi:DNA-binding MarR family transcriptional regulator
VDRLEGQGLVRRVPDREDRRRTLVMLTARGEALFERELPRQVAHLRARFDRLDKQEIAELQRLLRRLREVFS